MIDLEGVCWIIYGISILFSMGYMFTKSDADYDSEAMFILTGIAQAICCIIPILNTILGAILIVTAFRDKIKMKKKNGKS